MKISLRRPHAQTVQDCASSHKINLFSRIINLELKGFIGSKVTAVLVNGGICLLVELLQEGSAPAACAAGLFMYILVEYVFNMFVNTCSLAYGNTCGKKLV